MLHTCHTASADSGKNATGRNVQVADCAGFNAAASRSGSSSTRPADPLAGHSCARRSSCRDARGLQHAAESAVTRSEVRTPAVLGGSLIVGPVIGCRAGTVFMSAGSVRGCRSPRAWGLVRLVGASFQEIAAGIGALPGSGRCMGIGLRSGGVRAGHGSVVAAVEWGSELVGLAGAAQQLRAVAFPGRWALGKLGGMGWFAAAGGRDWQMPSS